MRKTVQFVLMLAVIASTLSLSATVIDRPQVSPSYAVATTTTSAPDFGASSFVREFRPEVRTFVPEFRRPNSNPNSGSSGGSFGPMFINLDRPQFDSRFVQPPNPNAPVGAPEPGSLALLASGLLSGVYFVRRRK